MTYLFYLEVTHCPLLMHTSRKTLGLLKTQSEPEERRLILEVPLFFLPLITFLQNKFWCYDLPEAKDAIEE